MAKKNKNAQENENENKNEAIQNPKAQGSENQESKYGFLFGLAAFITAFLIMIAVIGGVFFYAIKNNLNGIADKYRTEIKQIPILSMALPKLEDQDDPKNLTDEEIRKKYEEIKKERDELSKKLEAANKKNEELQKIKAQQDVIKAESEKVKNESAKIKAQSEEEKKKLEEDKKKLDEIVGRADKAGFKEFYEKMDKEIAQKIYAEIITEQKADADAKKFATLYGEMDAAAAAEIFQKLGASKMDLVVNILRYMKKESTSEVMASMDSDFAAKVTEKLSKYYMVTPTPKR